MPGVTLVQFTQYTVLVCGVPLSVDGAPPLDGSVPASLHATVRPGKETLADLGDR